MNDKKYFILISIVAVVSMCYISFNISLSNRLSSDYSFAAVISASSTSQSNVVPSGLPPESPTNYTDNKNGTITDNYTGLIWKKCTQGMSGSSCNSGSPSLREWSKANVECQKLNFAGKQGWRLPTLKELQSIVDTGKFDPSINTNFFAAIHIGLRHLRLNILLASSQFSFLMAACIIAI